MATSDLVHQHCKPYQAGAAPMNADAVAELLKQVPEWSHQTEAPEIRREFRFKNYYQTIAFVNALAWIAHQEDHHPDLEVGYNRCLVRFSTHSIGGLSENDFICAAKIDALLPPS